MRPLARPRGQIPSGRCPRCAFPLEGGCLCPFIPRLEVGVRVLVVRHASERPRLTNSGRWAAAALVGSEVYDHALDERRTDRHLAEVLGAGSAWLLYPASGTERPGGPLPRTLVVPDATWSQARHMVQRLGPLQTLPRLTLPAPPTTLRLREPPRAGGMSTLEAVAGALELLGDVPAAAALRRLHEVAVEKTLRLKGMWPPGRKHPRTEPS
jgi:DTW domain-containing protein YfiP